VRAADTSVAGLSVANDDHFVTAMAAVGTFPEIVKALLKLQTNNAAGIYVV
jgi:hypothetical protein